MYVCLCNAISDRQIRAVVERGAMSLAEVQAHLPVGNCCGSCQDCARTVIYDHLQATASRATAA